jgi:geranylgeranyl diphosphate synthase type II
MKKLQELLVDLEPAIADIISQPGSPRAVYEPISYILSLGGKRVRPAMVLAAYKLYKSEYSSELLKLAQAVEMFHNFTLLHDDIMDNSPLRRGQETVHIKWDDATAILSGDLLQIEVYEKLAEIGNVEILKLFNAMARELCEGQMNDMQFEKREEVSSDEYLDMIRQKTAVLLGFSLQAGAILGGASKEDGEKLYNLGISIGLSFQLMDDYLDSFGETAKVGKRIGGDILERKKTYLWNKTWEKLNDHEKQALLGTYKLAEEDTIAIVKEKMHRTGAANETLELAQRYSLEGIEILAKLSPSLDTTYLREIIELLASRES